MFSEAPNQLRSIYAPIYAPTYAPLGQKLSFDKNKSVQPNEQTELTADVHKNSLIQTMT